MKFSADYYQLVQLIGQSIDLPRVAGIHLPRPVEDAEKPDEFGFVFLSDGSAGPFYISLDDTLSELRKLYPEGRQMECGVLELAQQFLAESQIQRSVALGAFNALSQHVMARAGYSPVAHSIGKSKPGVGQKVAVVGFIRPMVEGLLANGHRVLVLERNPGRVEMLPGLELSTDPADLSGCDFIACTASTLINDSLGEILRHKQPSAYLSLIGPSGSGLPDILFEHGVDDVGGILVHDLEALQSALTDQVSWGHAGQKYQIARSGYPGIGKLLAAIAADQRQ